MRAVVRTDVTRLEVSHEGCVALSAMRVEARGVSEDGQRVVTHFVCQCGVRVRLTQAFLREEETV